MRGRFGSGWAFGDWRAVVTWNCVWSFEMGGTVKRYLVAPAEALLGASEAKPYRFNGCLGVITAALEVE